MELNPGGDVKIASWAVHKYMVRNKKVDETMTGRAGFNESCYLDFQINLRVRVSYRSSEIIQLIIVYLQQFSSINIFVHCQWCQKYFTVK